MKPDAPLSPPRVKTHRHVLRRAGRPGDSARVPWRITADVRTFFGISLFTYATYDLLLRPLLHWLFGR
jgi:hypothetical protein